MKFAVERLVNGTSKFEVVEADSPMDALHQDAFIGFKGSISGEDDERTLEMKNGDVATVGIYELGQFNHLLPISENMEKVSFFSKNWSPKNNREKLLDAGYDDEILNKMVEGEPLEEHENIYESELEEVSRNQ